MSTSISELNYRFGAVLEDMKNLHKEYLDYQMSPQCKRKNTEDTDIKNNQFFYYEKIKNLVEENEILKNSNANYDKKIKIISDKLELAKSMIKDRESYIEILINEFGQYRRLNNELKKDRELLERIIHIVLMVDISKKTKIENIIDIVHKSTNVYGR